MKKILLLSLLTTSLSFSAYAIDLPPSNSEIEAKLEGLFDFRAASRNQKKTEGNLTGNNKNFALDSNALFAATAFKKDGDMEYGAKIIVQTTAQAYSGGAFGGSHIYMIHEDYGKVELGSGYDAGSQMMVTGLDVEKGTGGGWSDYAYMPADVEHVPSPGGFFLGSGSFKNDNSVESSRKITYFTPKLSGLTFGISYIPDTGNIGSVSMSDVTRTEAKARTINANGYHYVEPKSVKNAISLGASFEQNLADGVDLKIAATGEFGKAHSQGTKQLLKPDSTSEIDTTAPVIKYKLSNMRTYNIGAVVTYGSFSYAASYGDVEGFTSKEVDDNRRRTQLYSTAAAYTQGPVGLSLSYLLTDARKNKVDAVTIGTDYKLSPGLVPYAELTCFKGRGRKPAVFNDPTKYTNKGTIALIGMKLKF